VNKNQSKTAQLLTGTTTAIKSFAHQSEIFISIQDDLLAYHAPKDDCLVQIAVFSCFVSFSK
jgi:hypothetical protein